MLQALIHTHADKSRGRRDPTAKPWEKTQEK